MSEHFFAVSALHAESMAAALNAFLASHRVVHVRRRFVDCGTESFWAYVVSTVGEGPASGQGNQGGSKAGKIDYRLVLTEPEFQVFSKLRELRKALSREEGVAIYAVGLNEQLADMVRQRMTTAADLAKLQGFATRYAAQFEAKLQELIPTLPVPAPKPTP